MAEAFAFTPMMKAADKTAGDVMDSSRPCGIVSAAYDDPIAKPTMANSFDPREQRKPGLESGKPILSISPAEIACQTARIGRLFVVQAGDQFMRRSTGITYRIMSVETLAAGVVRCSINILG